MKVYLCIEKWEAGGMGDIGESVEKVVATETQAIEWVLNDPRQDQADEWRDYTEVEVEEYIHRI